MGHHTAIQHTAHAGSLAEWPIASRANRALSITKQKTSERWVDAKFFFLLGAEKEPHKWAKRKMAAATVPFCVSPAGAEGKQDHLLKVIHKWLSGGKGMRIACVEVGRPKLIYTFVQHYKQKEQFQYRKTTKRATYELGSRLPCNEFNMPSQNTREQLEDLW